MVKKITATRMPVLPAGALRGRDLGVSQKPVPGKAASRLDSSGGAGCAGKSSIKLPKTGNFFISARSSLPRRSIFEARTPHGGSLSTHFSLTTGCEQTAAQDYGIRLSTPDNTGRSNCVSTALPTIPCTARQRPPVRTQLSLRELVETALLFAVRTRGKEPAIRGTCRRCRARAALCTATTRSSHACGMLR